MIFDLDPQDPAFTADKILKMVSFFVESSDINDINYISEGFLSRYAFKFEKKKSGLFGKIGKAVLTVALVAAAVAAVVYTGGTALAAMPAVAGALGITVTATTVASIGTAALVAVGVATGATAVGMTATAIVQDWRYSVKRNGERLKLDGRNTKVPSGYEIVELDKSRTLVQNYLDRVIIKDLD